jgi:hypothetical protein
MVNLEADRSLLGENGVTDEDEGFLLGVIDEDEGFLLGDEG